MGLSLQSHSRIFAHLILRLCYSHSTLLSSDDKRLKSMMKIRLSCCVAKWENKDCFDVRLQNVDHVTNWFKISCLFQFTQAFHSPSIAAIPSLVTPLKKLLVLPLLWILKVHFGTLSTTWAQSTTISAVNNPRWKPTSFQVDTVRV